jgi:SPOR domain
METCRKSRSRCRFLAPLMFLVLLGCSDDGYNYNGVRYDKFENVMAVAGREDAMLASNVRKRDQPVAGSVTALLPSEGFLSGLTSKENAIYLHQNHQSTIEALKHSNLFTAVNVEVYDKMPDPRPAGTDTVIFCCDWALYTPTNRPTGQPLPFDFTIEQRDRRMNQWIDTIEGTLVEQTASLGNAFRMQVAAVTSRDGAEATWAKLQRKHPQQLGGLQLTVVEITKDFGKMYRVQGGPFPDRAAAVDACMALKAANQNCLVVKP